MIRTLLALLALLGSGGGAAHLVDSGSQPPPGLTGNDIISRSTPEGPLALAPATVLGERQLASTRAASATACANECR